ncbi:DUF1456 family protein [Belliella marina]|uniref:DUF1456 family protein n=1 Tax=Belliella marina TaxID=1644146 RepID=A0ABW4VPP5_9BACT
MEGNHSPKKKLNNTIFRKPEQSQHSPCKNQVIRNFLGGLQEN